MQFIDYTCCKEVFCIEPFFQLGKDLTVNFICSFPILFQRICSCLNVHGILALLFLCQNLIGIGDCFFIPVSVEADDSIDEIGTDGIVFNDRNFTCFVQENRVIDDNVEQGGNLIDGFLDSACLGVLSNQL